MPLRNGGVATQLAVDEWESDNHVKGCSSCMGVPNSLPCVNDKDYDSKVRHIAAGLPPEGSNKIGGWKNNSPAIKKAYEKVIQFVQNPQGMLVLAGPRGTGKTHLGLMIAEERVAAKAGVLYSKVPRLLMNLRTSLSAQPPNLGYQEMFDRWVNIPCAVLDDLGQEKDSDWVQESLMLLLDMRYESTMATVITTNLDGQGIRERYGSALYDRLMDTQTGLATQVTCNWPSYRQKG